MNYHYPKGKSKCESDVNVSENPSDFGFAKNCGIPTTFAFEFEFKLQHIPG